ncbi:MAG: hypothetical protein RL567_1085 [Bacteroidota bacterium]|jgi:type I restriction enzyme, S subunit
MKKYDSYKDSGIEWIGEIPIHWEAKRIKLFSQVKRGASPRPIDDQKYFDENGEYAWVRIADVTASDRYLLDTTQRLSELGASLSVKRHDGDFFLSIAGSVGKPMITKIKCCIHDGFVYFPNLSLNPEFLYYIFQTGLPYLGLGKLGTQLNLNTETVGNIFITIPPDEEIEIIVNYLDQKTSQIDNLIGKKEALIHLLEEERVAVINQAVTKGLDLKVPMKDSGAEWLDEIPEHWKVKKIKFIALLKSGENITSESIKEEGDYPVYGGNGLRGFYSEFTNDGDYILIGRQGALCGNIKYARNRFWASEHAIVCYLEPDNNWLWFGKLLESMNLNQYNQSAAQPGLAVGVIKNLSIPFPSIEYQNEIVEFIIDHEKKTDEIIEKTKNEIRFLKEYKTALISEVVTGKVDVRNEKLN